jgi:hypothetical protein
MKPFLFICLVMGAIGAFAATSCGPQKPFCPNRTDNECVSELDSGSLEDTGGPPVDPCGTRTHCTGCGASVCCFNAQNVCVQP